MRRIAATAAALALAASVFAIATPASAATSARTDNVGMQSVITVMNGLVNRPITVDDPGRVTDITVRVDFRKVSQTCAGPGTGSANSTELGFGLTSPSGTIIRLVNEQNNGKRPSYSNNSSTSAAGRVSVLFDDDASTAVGSTNNGLPVSGTFRPADPLSTFDGEPAAGQWLLSPIDMGYNFPLCYYGATLTIKTDTPPTFPGSALPDGLVGAAYTAGLPAISGVTYAATSLPDGLELNAASGRITGTPTAGGVYDFTATVTDADGLTSSPTSFRITIMQPASLTGPATAAATPGVSFAYTPMFTPGYPATTVSVVGDLPSGLSIDPATGEISGTPADAMGEYPVELRAAASVAGDAARLPLTIVLAPGPVARLLVTPSATVVDQGGSVDLAVSGEDAAGNPVDVADDIAVTSDVATDVVSGTRVTFPTASPHTITVRHLPTGVTSTTVVDVTPAAAGGDGDDAGPTPDPEPMPDPGENPDPGDNPEPGENPDPAPDPNPNPDPEPAPNPVPLPDPDAPRAPAPLPDASPAPVPAATPSPRSSALPATGLDSGALLAGGAAALILAFGGAALTTLAGRANRSRR